MRIVVQLIENFLFQEIPTIIIHTDNKKFIFNVPTCFQRFTKEHSLKFPKGGHYFFTKVSSSTIAGLNGFMLTIF